MHARTSEQTQARIDSLVALRRRVDDELTVLTAKSPSPRGRRGEPLTCGTERAYQRHAYLGDTSDGVRKVTCHDCLDAHAHAERARVAARRLGWVS